MNTEELKQTIETQTGIPANLLNGETIEETIAHAKALLAYKREADAERPKTTAEQFAEWMNTRNGIEQPDIAGEALARIEEQARVEAGGYPILRDGGSVNNNLGDGRTVREQFAEWAGRNMAYDPRKSADGWTPLF